MTAAELKTEWSYRYEERLGILCGADRPTPAQRQLAAREADEAIEKLAHSDFGLTTAQTRPFDCP